jgi:hypothetical protein
LITAQMGVLLSDFPFRPDYALYPGKVTQAALARLKFSILGPIERFRQKKTKSFISFAR